ncbi:MAG: glycosyltransferase [Hyphomicrobium sp.]|jgi:polysaccharide deacetylase family protein (PEP-CTERM system associated)
MYTGQHLISVNLEDYFQVAPMRRVIPSKNWPRFELRIEQSTLAALDLLDRHGHKATFFVLGWLAEHCPDLIAEVARRGHMVASKGYLHRAFSQLTLEEFDADLRRSQDAIGNAIGQSISGYRIAEGSLPIDNTRAFEVLARAGIKYDSSIRPFGLAFVRHAEWRNIRTLSGRTASTGADWSLTEVPLSSDTLLGMPLPMTGGNYLRQMPDALYKRQLRSFLDRTHAPWHLYFHVWELDPNQPRVSATTRLGRIRQYRNLEKMRERLDELLASYKFRSIESHLGLVPRPFTPARPKPAVLGAIAAATAEKTRATIVVPCFNEEESLPYLASTLESFAKENAGSLMLSYVFVDDGSRDRTWEKLHELFGTRSDCKLVKHPKNMGIAAATMTGIRHANDEVVCGIDCDCSFDPHELAKMIPLLKPGIDMVQASPYHRDGGVVNVPAWRLALSRNLSRIYSLILTHRFASYTACFRVYRRSAISKITLSNNGFMGIMEMFILLDRSGSKIVEYPAVLETRLLGVSKMKTLSVIRSHLGMIAELLLKPGSVAKRANVTRPAGTPIATEKIL